MTNHRTEAPYGRTPNKSARGFAGPWLVTLGRRPCKHILGAGTSGGQVSAVEAARVWQDVPSWIKLYSTLKGNGKLLELAVSLRLRPAYAAGHLCFLWTEAMDQREDGDLSSWSDERIAISADYTANAQEFVRLLHLHKLLDGQQGRNGQPRQLLIHDWLDYAGPFLIRKYGSKRKEVLAQIWAKHGRIYGVGESKVTCNGSPAGHPGVTYLSPLESELKIETGSVSHRAENPNGRAPNGYFPFLGKDAKEVVDAYQRAVGTAHPPAGAQAAVLEILGNREATKDELLAAVKVWGPACKKANADPTKRMSAGKWFRDGCWRDFMGDVVLNDPDARNQKRNDLLAMEAERRRIDAERYARELAEHPEIATASSLEEFERRRKAKNSDRAMNRIADR